MTEPRSTLRADPEVLGQCWDALVIPGAVHEVRLPKTRRGPARLWGVASGYFDDRDAFVAALAPLTGADAEGIFVTLNPVAPALLARAANRLVCGKPSTTADADVVRLRRLLLDLDPVRPAGISATDTERDAAVARREAIRHYLRAKFGWPHPEILLETGNGAALVYRLADLPNDPDHTSLVRATLGVLDQLFSDAVVAVDTSTYNPSRLVKIAGTIAAKGDHVPRIGRPWRRVIADCNPNPQPVSIEMLRGVVATAESGAASGPSTAPSGPKHDLGWNVRSALRECGIAFHEKPKPWAAVLELDRCLTSTDHADGAAIFAFPSGALAYRCLHASCAGKDWGDVRVLLGLAEKVSQAPSVAATSEIRLPSGVVLGRVRGGGRSGR